MRKRATTGRPGTDQAVEVPAVTPDGPDAAPGDAGRKRSRPSLKNWRVRRRLFAIILIPTLTAGAFGGLRIAQSASNAVSYQHVEQQAHLGAAVIGLANAMEDERDVLAGYLARGKPAGMKPALEQRYQATDQAAKKVRDLAGTIGSSYPASVRSDVTTVKDLLSAVSAFRVVATSTHIPAMALIADYSDTIGALLTFEDEVAQGSSDSILAERVRALSALARSEDEGTQQRGILYAGLSLGSFPAGAYSALVNAQAQQAADYTEFAASASLNEQQVYSDTVTGPAVDQAATAEMQAIASGSGGPIVLGAVTGTSGRAKSSAKDRTAQAQAWYSAMSTTVGKMRVVEQGLISSIFARSTALRAAAVRSLVIWGGIILAVLIVVVLITLIVGRSMVGPLRRLREGALEVAGVRLPEMVRKLGEGGAEENLDVTPIAVSSTDEIGEVARAFDQVHREAVRLASNEAALRGNVNAMFMNLSRRSQSLVERQIRLIDDLEQGEQDAERLGNLFQLDHLATRMRRNSENLLVLAGHDVTRRWTQAVALVDVLRAAASEIEQYERVTLNVQSGIAVRGQAVSDVVHLIAELVENATSFSAADTPVNVAGHLLGSGGVLLEITDQGVGMEAEEMAHANWRLDNPPVVDVAVSRRMGLFVVARLAARHGIRVRLRPSPRGGLTALVWLPDEVISNDITAVPIPRGMEIGGYGVGSAGTDGRPELEWQTGAESGDRSLTMRALNAARAPRFTALRPDAGEAEPFLAHDGDLDARPMAEGGSSHESGSTVVTDTGPLPSAMASGPIPAGSGPVPADEVPPPAASSTGPVPVFGAPLSTEGQRVQWAAGEDVRGPFDGEASGDHRGVVVPPAAIAGEGNRLPIFESVESDWFRRGRHGSDRGAQLEGVAASSWASPADRGWQAAEAAYAPASGGTTRAGLPRRIPRANLVPGSADADASAGVGAGASEGRSAAQTRERLASFQRGVREGRAAARGYTVTDGDENDAR